MSSDGPPREYQCVITTIVWALDGGAVGTVRRTLPFAPFPGLCLTELMVPGVDTEDGEEVKRVVWDHRLGEFRLYLIDDTDSPVTLEEAKKLYSREFLWEHYESSHDGAAIRRPKPWQP